MGKGVLLRQEGRRGIVLTPDGQFQRVRLSRPAAIGEEVAFPDTTPRAAPAAWWAAAAAVVLLAALSLLRPLVTPLPAVALVAVDINPSVELWVTAGERVRSVRALNADGERVLAEVRARGRPASEVVKAITEAAVRLGLLRPDDREAMVLITISPAARPEGAAPALEGLHDALYRAAEEVIRSHRGVAQVQTLEADPAEREKAESLGLSPGKYMLYEELRAEHPDKTLRPEEIRDLRPGEIIRQFGGDSVETVVERVRGRQAKKGLFPGRSPGNPPPALPPGKDEKDRGEKDKEGEDRPAPGRDGAPASPGPRPGGDRDAGRDEGDRDAARDKKDRKGDAGEDRARGPAGDGRGDRQGRERQRGEGDGNREQDTREGDGPGKDGGQGRRSGGGILPSGLEEKIRPEHGSGPGPPGRQDGDGRDERRDEPGARRNPD